jgi:uncharacterized protein (TIGR00661 family)
MGKLSVFPVDKLEFASSMASARGILCGAGFETPAETLFLEKKLMVVPMKSQLEQHYNAASLKQLGVPVLKKMKKSNMDKVREWIESEARTHVDYQDTTAEAVDMAMKLARQ